MTKREREIVRKHLKAIYHNWHVCGLSKKEARDMGLKPGRLCDDCHSAVIGHMAAIKLACGD